MNTVTLNSMALDNFEVADNEDLANVEGEGWLLGAAGAVLVVLVADCQPLVLEPAGIWGGAIGGATAWIRGLAITTPISFLV